MYEVSSSQVGASVGEAISWMSGPFFPLLESGLFSFPAVHDEIWNIYVGFIMTI